MDNLSAEYMSTILENLEEVTKCPVCLTTLRPPLGWCENGHAICGLCKMDLTKCPTCKGNLITLQMKPTLINCILNVLPRECIYSENGCHFFLSPPDLKVHETRCSFREVDCRLRDCTWKGEANNLKDHIETIHTNVKLFKFEDSINVYFSSKSKQNHLVSPVYAFDCIFWKYLKVNREKNKCYLLAVCIPTESDIENDFYSITTFSKRNSQIEYKYTQKVFDEFVDTDEMFEGENCMAIPMSEVDKHFIIGGKMKYSFKIFEDGSDIQSSENEDSN